MEAAIERIEKVNPALNAVVTKMYDEARSAAANGRPDGPFKGVPFLLKDLGGSYAGVRMTSGSASMRDHVPDHDSELVACYRRSGLLVLGKTNTPEFGLHASTEPVLFGPCRNPWDIGKTTSGSSGGSAAAVASGMVPLAHGNDGGGSIRCPASACGVFGLKPTRARITGAPDSGELLGGIGNNHVLTVSVRDSAAALDATAGPGIGDPFPAPVPQRPYLEEVGADPGRLRIAVSMDVPEGYILHEDCAAALRDAADLCERLGHDVEEVVPDFIDQQHVFHHFFETYWASLADALVSGWARGTGQSPSTDYFEPYTLALAEQGRGFSAADLVAAMNAMQALARRVGEFQEPYDI